MPLLNGKNVVLTGAGGGLGKALSDKLLDEGANLALITSDPKKCKSAEEKAKKLGRKFIVIKSNVADWKSASASAEKIIKDFGSIDVLINVAGGWFPGALSESSADQIEKDIEGTLKSAIYSTKSFLPQFLKQNRGSVIFVSALRGRTGSTANAVPSATKFAVTGLAESLRKELNSTGVKTMTIFPGSFASRLPEYDPPKEKLKDGDGYTQLALKDVVEAILFMTTRSEQCSIDELSIRAVNE